MWTRHSGLFLVAFASLGLFGCGHSTPKISEVLDTDYSGDPPNKVPPISATAQIELEIKTKVYCELKRAVRTVNDYFVTKGGKSSSLLPPEWIAQVALSLQVDESVALNPGLSWTQLMPNAVKVFGVQNGVQNSVTTPQSFTFGIGATLSSTATRIDKFNPQYSIKFLSKPDTKYSICLPQNDPLKQFGLVAPSSSPFLIESDLGIVEWLLGAMVVNRIVESDVTTVIPATAAQLPAGRGPGTGSPGGGGTTTKADTVSYEMKFVIVSNGNVTPTWKLVRASANTGSGSFFGVGRTRTHDLIITIGPDTPATNNASVSSQIAAGVAAAIRSLNPGGM